MSSFAPWPVSKFVDCLIEKPDADFKSDATINGIRKMYFSYWKEDRSRRIDWHIKKAIERRVRQGEDDSYEDAVMVWEKAKKRWQDVVTCKKPTPEQFTDSYEDAVSIWKKAKKNWPKYDWGEKPTPEQFD